MFTDFQLQMLMKENSYYTEVVDGLFGPKSWLSVKNILSELEITYNQNDKSKIQAAQACLNWQGYHAGIVDGFWGYSSQSALDAWVYKNTNGHNAPTIQRIKVEGKIYNKEQMLMPLQRDVPKVYGAPGTQQVKFVPPYKLRQAWNPEQTQNYFYCHSAISQRLSQIMNEVFIQYGEFKIKELGLDLYGGCYQNRPMRGGKTLSMHAYAIALDFDPTRNTLKQNSKQANFALPEYQDWFNIWEKYGAISLGLAADMDWQHLQFARI